MKGLTAPRRGAPSEQSLDAAACRSGSREKLVEASAVRCRSRDRAVVGHRPSQRERPADMELHVAVVGADTSADRYESVIEKIRPDRRPAIRTADGAVIHCDLHDAGVRVTADAEDRRKGGDVGRRGLYAGVGYC